MKYIHIYIFNTARACRHVECPKTAAQTTTMTKKNLLFNKSTQPK